MPSSDQMVVQQIQRVDVQEFLASSVMRIITSRSLFPLVSDPKGTAGGMVFPIQLVVLLSRPPRCASRLILVPRTTKKMPRGYQPGGAGGADATCAGLPADGAVLPRVATPPYAQR